MQEYEDRGFNPIRFGLIAALTIAAVVGSVLVWRSFSANKAVQTAQQQELEKLQQENELLKEKLEKLTNESTETADKLKKQLLQRDSLLSSVKRQRETESRTASSQIAELTKQKVDTEAKLAQAKKDSDQAIKKAQEQLNKLQMDLQHVKADSERYAKSYNTLKAKLDKISEGDQAAADMMVQELAEARKQLKREQEARKKLEEQLQGLQQQVPPPPQ